MRSRVASIALVVALGPALSPPRIVADVETPEFPEITAQSWLLYDADAGVTLASHNADEPRPMASVTKMMTALVVVENAGLDESVRVSATAEAVGEAEIGLFVGELWSVADLLAAVMVRSGNDAAMALAEHVGGDIKGFAAMMNAKAEQLGLQNSHFVNPHGLDAAEHYTSATDLRMIAEAVLKNPYLSRLARTREVEFKPESQGRGAGSCFDQQAARRLSGGRWTQDGVRREGREGACVGVGAQRPHADRRGDAFGEPLRRLPGTSRLWRSHANAA